MKSMAVELPDLRLFEPDIMEDTRGFFMETFQAERYREAGVAGTFIQDNLSRSSKGVLRGLHFQYPNPQGKLVSVLEGEVFDVAVDLRQGSPDFGRWAGVLLSGYNRRQLWVPEGFAHGFCVVSPTALLSYKCTAYYSPCNEHTLRWDDPMIGVQWPQTAVTLSAKDRVGVLLADMDPNWLPVYEPQQGSAQERLTQARRAG